MNFSVICYIVGYVLRIEGILFLLPAIVGACCREQACISFFIMAAITFAVGFALAF